LHHFGGARFANTDNLLLFGLHPNILFGWEKKKEWISFLVSQPKISMLMYYNKKTPYSSGVCV
jgi:hypothetical protein